MPLYVTAALARLNVEVAWTRNHEQKRYFKLTHAVFIIQRSAEPLSTERSKYSEFSEWWLAGWKLRQLL
jgi:hypothetical protein